MTSWLVLGAFPSRDNNRDMFRFRATKRRFRTSRKSVRDLIIRGDNSQKCKISTGISMLRSASSHTVRTVGFKSA